MCFSLPQGLKCLPAVLLVAALEAFGSSASAGGEAPYVEGIVLTHLGAGIPDAQVRIETLDARADDPPLAVGTTDQIGDFLIRLPATLRTPVRVRIQKQGYLEYVMVVDPTDPDDPPYVDVVLEGAGTLSGAVRAAAGARPIASASMYCDNSGRTLETTTDAAGAYRFDGVARGAAVVRVIAEGFAIERKRLEITEDDARMDIALMPELPLEVEVRTDRGEPAAGVLVEVLVQSSNTYLSATSDADGMAVVRGVAADAPAIRLRANGQGFAQDNSYGQPIALPAATQPAWNASEPQLFRHRLTMTVAGSVRGKVIEVSSGRGVVGVRVISGRQVRSNMPMIWTSLDGTYELAGLEPGLNVLSYQRAGYATAIHEVEVIAGEAVTQDVHLEAGQPIGGIVVNDLGRPLEQVWVTAEEWQGYRTLGLRAITQDDGTFLLPNAPPGRIEFSFVLAGHAPLRDQVLDTGKTDHRIVLPASPAAAAREVFDSKLKVGDEIPDFSLTAPDGTTYSLSSLRGKYVFLDFWASWCGPCIAEIPHIKALHEATKNRADFLLIGVSLDQDERAFRRVVTRKQMDWLQIVGPRSGAEEAFETLEGFGIPYTCLIGPDGKLLAQHLRGSQMVSEVMKHLPP